MIIDGVMLMVIGMSVVFVFLILLNIAINFLASLTKEHALVEQEAIKAEEKALRDKKSRAKGTGTNTSLVAAVAAAIKLRA